MPKKAISSLLIVILLVLFAGTYYCSQLTESLVTRGLSRLNRQLPGPFRAELLDYRRGLFVSRARTRITGGPSPLPLEHHLRHYLWGTTVRTTVAAERPAADPWQQLFPPEQCTLLSRIGFSGHTRTVLDCFNPLAEETSGAWTVSGLTINGEATEKPAAGNLSLHLKQLQLLVQGRPVTLGDLSLTTALTRQPGTINSSLELTLGSMMVAAESFQELRLNLELSDLPPELARELLEAAIRLEQSEPASLESRLSLLLLARHLLESNLRLEVHELTASHAGGDIRGQGWLQLGGSADPLNGLLKLSALDASGQLRFDLESFRAGYQLLKQLQSERVEPLQPEALRAEADLILARLLRRGLVRKRPGEDLYGIDLRLQDGRLTLNEKS